MAQVQIQSLSHRHQEIADWLLANPNVKNLQVLCDRMGISRSWLSVVMKSDVFKEYFDERRRSHEKELKEKITLRQLGVTLQALDKLENIIADEDVDDRLVFDIANKTAQNLGFGPSRGPHATVIEERTQELTMRTVDPQTLAEARETIRRITKIEQPAPDSE